MLQLQILYTGSKDCADDIVQCFDQNAKFKMLQYIHVRSKQSSTFPIVQERHFRKYFENKEMQ